MTIPSRSGGRPVTKLVLAFVAGAGLLLGTAPATLASDPLGGYAETAVQLLLGE
jgi:hypothetical protein